MAKVTWLWHGGSSYSVPGPEDAETFPSLKAAKEAFWRRACLDLYYPCVTDDVPEDGGPEAWVFYGTEAGDYPDKIMRFGPRGGVRVENC